MFAREQGCAAKMRDGVVGAWWCVWSLVREHFLRTSQVGESCAQKKKKVRVPLLVHMNIKLIRKLGVFLRENTLDAYQEAIIVIYEHSAYLVLRIRDEFIPSCRFNPT